MILLIAAFLQSAAPVAQPTPSPMVCKTFDEIGSRVRKRKVCRTRDDWQRIAQGESAQGAQMRDLQATFPKGQ